MVFLLSPTHEIFFGLPQRWIDVLPQDIRVRLDAFTEGLIE